MLNSILQMFGGGPHKNRIQDNLESVTGVIILDLQSVLVYGTNGRQINRHGNSDYIKEFFRALHMISKYNNIKIYILSDGMSVESLNNLIKVNVEDEDEDDTITDLIKQMFEKDVNYHIFSNRSSKKSALTQILEIYKEQLKGSGSNNLKKILYFARLETDNIAREENNYKSISTKYGNTQKFIPYLVDGPKNYSSKTWNFSTVMHSIKSLKELMYYPFYASPFALHPQHYKSMMRHIDTTYEILKGAGDIENIQTVLLDLLDIES